MSKKGRRGGSFLYFIILYFVVLVIIPLVISWIFYEGVLRSYYAKIDLERQQEYLESSLGAFEDIAGSVETIFATIEGNQDLQYYLVPTQGKKMMMARCFYNIRQYCLDIQMFVSYVEDINIYCDSPLIFYAKPLARLSDMKIEDACWASIDKLRYREIAWYFVQEECEEYPTAYGYQKLFASNFQDLLGYIEIKISPRLFEEYFLQMQEYFGEQSIVDLYFGAELIKTSASSSPEYDVKKVETNFYEFFWAENVCRNYVLFPEMNLKIVRTGSFIDDGTWLSWKVPSILIFAILLLLLMLFLVYFYYVLSVSRRIRQFSEHISSQSRYKLKAYEYVRRKPKREDEVDRLILAFNSLIGEKNGLISQIEKKELYIQSIKYQVLQSQINPHFLYGTLESIRMIAAVNEDEECADMIMSLSGLLRYTLSVNAQTVALKDEVTIADHFMLIQKKRIGDRLKYERHVEESLMDFSIPPLSFQPILENAIMYGVLKTYECCTIILDVYRDKDAVIMRISNSGVTISEKRLVEVNQMLSGKLPKEEFAGNNRGIALYNIKERMEMHFKGKASVRLKLTETETITEICIWE